MKALIFGVLAVASLIAAGLLSGGAAGR